MKRITTKTVDGQTIEVCYNPAAAEGSRYAVDGRPAIQSPRPAGSVWEVWVPRDEPGPPYEIYRISGDDLQRLRDAPDLPTESGEQAAAGEMPT